MTKTEFRKKHKNIRNNISAEDASKKSSMIYDNLIDLEEIKNLNTFFVYMAYGREVSTTKLIKYLFENGKTVLIPKCNVSSETMIPVVYNNESKLTDNIYGIKEVKQSEEYTGDIDVIVVPGIAFDKFGNRLGHGKGYYDKFLQNSKILKIALCYSENLCDEIIPHDDYDVSMDYIITDREVLKLSL